MESTICINTDIYWVKCLLGKGKGGYSYLVTDGKTEYVLKQLHHEPCDYYQFGNKLACELRDYEILRKLNLPIPELLAVDTPNERLLKQYIPGSTAADLVKENRMKQEYISQVLQIYHILYAADLNIDYYPTNFVLQDKKLWFVDYECNPYDAQWHFQHWGLQYWQTATS